MNTSGINAGLKGLIQGHGKTMRLHLPIIAKLTPQKYHKLYFYKESKLKFISKLKFYSII